ncbi:MAG: hypothetical protein ACSHYB_09495 [Roseibacillus sp.]
MLQLTDHPSVSLFFFLAEIKNDFITKEMKSLATLLFISAAASISAFAELDIPRRSYPLAELEEAKAYATEQEKPLIFVDT